MNPAAEQTVPNRFSKIPAFPQRYIRKCSIFFSGCFKFPQNTEKRDRTIQPTDRIAERRYAIDWPSVRR